MKKALILSAITVLGAAMFGVAGLAKVNSDNGVARPYHDSNGEPIGITVAKVPYHDSNSVLG